MIRRFVPVYLITGFLESGKTTLGLTILGNERFTNGGKALILCCEEGEVEWDEKSLKEEYRRSGFYDKLTVTTLRVLHPKDGSELQ